jgi:CRISPR/Cas system CMR-associated protein Cmr3 (group 5 of RAMP superfamily)
MTFEEAKEQARKGIKVTHRYFTKNEYMIMQGNQIVFEDGCKIFVDEWAKGKDYLNDGWSIYVA